MATWTTMTVSERHAFDLLAPMYPATNWSVALLPGRGDARASVQGYILHPRTCDVLIAAGMSTATLALSPLVPTSTAWVDASATSQELTSIERHPAFNRVIPGDEVAGTAVAALAYRVGWRSVSVLCDNDAYGRSLVDTFSTSFSALGGTVETVLCAEVGAPQSDVQNRVDQLLTTRRCRAVFVAGSVGLQAQLAETGLHARALVLMVETCTETVLLMPGALCATYTPEPCRFDAFRASRSARDFSPLYAEFAAVGLNDTAAINTAKLSANIFGALGHDAVQHAMHGVYTFPDAAQTAPSMTMAEYLRTYATPGITGDVVLNHNGNRASAMMALTNSYRDAVTGVIATAVVGIGNSSDLLTQAPRFNATRGRPAEYFWLNGTFSDTFAVNDLRYPANGARGSTELAAALSVVVALALLLGAFAARYVTRPQPLEHCPLDDALPLTVLFVGVANEAELNDIYTPESVAAATQTMAKLVRKAVRASNCYEAQRVNDGTFMIVAKSPDRALDCAARIARTVSAANLDSGCNARLCPTAAAVAVMGDSGGSSTTMSCSGRNGRAAAPPPPPPAAAPNIQRNGSAVPPDNVPPVAAGPGSASQRRRRLPYVVAGQSRFSVRHQASTTNHHHPSKSGDSPRAPSAQPLPRFMATVGVAHGFASIDQDAEHGVLSYHGPLLAAAAAATDAGVPGQIVVTEALIDALEQDGRAFGGTFDLYLHHQSSGASSATASAGGEAHRVNDGALAAASADTTTVATAGDSARGARGGAFGANRPLTFFTYTPPGLPGLTTEVTDAVDARRSDAARQRAAANSAGSVGDSPTIHRAAHAASAGRGMSLSIASALTRASTGVAARRCAIALVHLSALASASDAPQQHARQVTVLLSTLIRVAARHKCHVHDVVGTAVVVSANAVGPAVSMASLRVTQFATEVIEAAVSGHAQHRVSVGIAVGSTSAAGSVDGVSVMAGTLAEQARLALAAARDLGLPCVLAMRVSAPPPTDVTDHFALIPVDVASIFDPAVSIAGAGLSSSQGGPASNHRHGGIALMCSVEDPSVVPLVSSGDGAVGGIDDAEWLYARGASPPTTRARGNSAAVRFPPLPPCGGGGPLRRRDAAQPQPAVIKPPTPTDTAAVRRRALSTPKSPTAAAHHHHPMPLSWKALLEGTAVAPPPPPPPPPPSSSQSMPMPCGSVAVDGSTTDEEPAPAERLPTPEASACGEEPEGLATTTTTGSTDLDTLVALHMSQNDDDGGAGAGADSGSMISSPPPPAALAIAEARLRAAWSDPHGLAGYAVKRGSQLRGALVP